MHLKPHFMEEKERPPEQVTSRVGRLKSHCLMTHVQWNLDTTNGEGSLHRGSFSNILLLPGQRKSFVNIPRTSLRFGISRFNCKAYCDMLPE